MTISAAFDALRGLEADFYGVDLNKFKLDDMVWEAIEDEDDGYRSLLDTVMRRDCADGIFFAQSLARVRVIESDDGYNEYYRLIDVADGHCWLEFGTQDYYDYYPCFRFEYTPKLETQR